MADFEWPGRRRQFAILGVIVLVVTAGCAGLGAPDENGDDTTDADNPEDPNDGNESDESGDTDNDSTNGGEGGTSDATGSNSTGEADVFGDLEPVESDLTGEDVLAESVDALGAVDSYRLVENTTSLVSQNNQQLTIQLDRAYRVDRPNQQLAIDITTNTQGRTVTQDQYLQNGTLHQRSRQIAQRYGTEWLRTNVSDSFDQQFAQLDQLELLEQLLGNTSATLEGQTAVDGQQAYAVSAQVNSTAVTEIRPTVVETDRLELSLWISTETARPLRIVENSTLSEIAPQGELPQELNRSFSYSYDPIEITLPPAAEDAPLASDVTQ
jgi:hypothetical protein